jgi:hypothetical protein
MMISNQTPARKRKYRKMLSERFCRLNGMKVRSDLSSNDRRSLVRTGAAERRLNNGHKLNIQRKLNA